MSTSRLKRKAEDNDLLQDNNLNESFVQYGTALPSLASTKKDQGEYVPVWKQEVRDEQGRRRLHGAFTGGFSAGYFNTAGSKEGWAPATFVSKKEAKGKQREQRPEDYMDEEDLAELKEARSFKTSDSYGGGQARPQEAFAGLGVPSASAGPSTNADPGYAAAVANSLKDLVKPGSRRIGQKIMTKMGWRPGQGVGPRISYARRKEQMRELGMQVDEEQDDEEDEEAKKHTFAPLDRDIVTFAPKDNQWGLGYVPGASLLQHSDTQSSMSKLGSASYSVSTSDKARFGGLGGRGEDGPRSQVPTGGAFGISALEEPDEDDIDVYGTGASESRTFVLNDDEHDDFAFPGSSMQKRKPKLFKWNDSNKKVRSTAAAEKIAPRERQVFNDGSPLVNGFVLANKLQQPDKWFAADPVPKGWQPNPKAVWERERLKAASPAQAGAANIPQAQKKGQQNMLSADDRANMLGEPVAPKSIFDFLSSKDKERLKAVSEGKESGPSKHAIDPASRNAVSEEEPEVLRIPALDSRVAQGALKGFMPYGDDLAKQARYKAFLQYSAMLHDPSKPFKPPTLPGKSINDMNAELEAFANAAMIFKPMSGMMANRFTSSQSMVLDVNAPQAGLRVPTPKSKVEASQGLSKEEEEAKRQQEREASDPRRAAIREGNFGPLTRTIEPWYPSRLLCKRFNVADPHPDGPPQSSGTASFSFTQPSTADLSENDILSKNAMNDMMQDRKASNTTDGFLQGLDFTVPAVVPTSSEAEASRMANEYDAPESVTLTYEKPSMDIFKAIFASDDEDEDEEDETVVAATSAALPSQTMDDPSQIPDITIFEPKQPEKPLPMKVEDLANFKPSFISRSDRTTNKDDAKKKDKDKKKKKKVAAVLSFEVDDDPEDVGAVLSIDKKRKSESKPKDAKKSKKENHGSKAVTAQDDEDEWVEKAVSPAVAPAPTEANGADQGSSLRKYTRVTASELF